MRGRPLPSERSGSAEALPPAGACRCGQARSRVVRARRCCSRRPLSVSLLVARYRREVGMDDWAWEQLAPWLKARVQLPVGPLFCVVTGPTRGRPWSAAAARSELRRVARHAGVRRRFAPHQLRHAHAVEMAREGVPLIVIQRQLGHTNLGSTSIYLRGIDNTEISTPSTRAARPWSPSTARSASEVTAAEGSRHPSAARPRPTEQRAAQCCGSRRLLLPPEAVGQIR